MFNEDKKTVVCLFYIMAQFSDFNPELEDVAALRSSHPRRSKRVEFFYSIRVERKNQKPESYSRLSVSENQSK